MNGNESFHPNEELAALFVAGALSPQEMEAVEWRLSQGDDDLRAAIAGLDSAARALFECVPETPPSPNVRDALLAKIGESDKPSNAGELTDPQVWKHWGSDEANEPLLIRRSGDLTWEPTGIEGIQSRRLFVDVERDQTTMMVRMAPGTSYPRHLHAGPEECYVLEGDLRVGDEVLHAGDYQRAAPGSHHPVQSTEGGCLLLLVSSLSDELE